MPAVPAYHPGWRGAHECEVAQTPFSWSVDLSSDAITLDERVGQMSSVKKVQFKMNQ